MPHGHRGAIAQFQIALHERAAKIQHAMLEAHGLRETLLVHLEYRRERRIEDIDFSRQHLDFAARQIRIDRPGRPLADLSRDGNHVLATQPLGDLEGLGGVGIAYDLQQALAVAQVDEDHAAVVPAPVYPSAHADRLAQVFAVNESAILGSREHHDG